MAQHETNVKLLLIEVVEPEMENDSPPPENFIDLKERDTRSLISTKDLSSTPKRSVA